jgi:hypothetical protein
MRIVIPFQLSMGISGGLLDILNGVVAGFPFMHDYIPVHMSVSMPRTDC